jgi:hypothetical protein
MHVYTENKEINAQRAIHYELENIWKEAIMA